MGRWLPPACSEGDSREDHLCPGQEQTALLSSPERVCMYTPARRVPRDSEAPRSARGRPDRPAPRGPSQETRTLSPLNPPCWPGPWSSGTRVCCVALCPAQAPWQQLHCLMVAAEEALTDMVTVWPRRNHGSCSPTPSTWKPHLEGRRDFTKVTESPTGQGHKPRPPTQSPGPVAAPPGASAEMGVTSPRVGSQPGPSWVH